MNMLSHIRRRLGLKLFISYLVIIITGIIVLAVSAEFVIPSAFNRHMSAMMSDSGIVGGMMGEDMNSNLYTNFRSAVGEALFRAGLAAFVVAVGVSVYISRRIVSPIQEMTTASQHIADGHYDQRVQVPGNIASGDLDELAQLALSFNQMAEKLYQTENMRIQLIGDISHELRTPLTAIKGSMEGLLDEVLSPTTATFQQIYLEADRLQRLVADLQELSRVEAGEVSLHTIKQDISSLIESVAYRLSPQFQDKEVALDVDLPPALPHVLVDEDRFSQVLINLLGNALQYTPEGGKVSLSAQQVGQEIQVRVKDTGIGIPAEHLQHIFARFYRVDKSRSRVGGGSGIGLTIARHLVEAHGGRIWVESEGSGKGSMVAFTLPITNGF
jgi:signal transduction histidine kinase